VESRSSQGASAEGSARLGAVIAAAGGVVLIISLFLTWYEVTGAGIAESITDVIDDVTGSSLGGELSRTGWESFEFTDLICAFAGGMAMVRGLVALAGDDDNPPIPGPMLVTALGAVAAAAVAYRIANPPGVGFDREIGVWIGLLGAAGVAYGSAIALRAAR